MSQCPNCGVSLVECDECGELMEHRPVEAKQVCESCEEHRKEEEQE